MKKLISILMLLTLIVSAAFAEEIKPEDFAFGDFILRQFNSKNGETVLHVVNLTNEGKKKETLILPPYIYGKKVTGIVGTPWDAKCKSIVLPETVTYVGSFCKNPNLESINLENINRLWTGFFQDCVNLKSIGPSNKVPSKVGGSVFAGTALEYVIIDTETMGGRPVDDETAYLTGEFANCKNLRTVYFTDRLKEIGASNFAGCTSLDYVCFSKALEILSWRTFRDCVNLRTAVFYGEPAILNNGYLWGSIRPEDSLTPVFENCPKLTIIGKKPTHPYRNKNNYNTYFNYEEYANAFGISFIPAIINHGEPSTVVAQAQQTATVTINGTDIPSYTVNGSVYVGESALRSIGFTTVWDGEARTTTVTAPENVDWSAKLNTNPDPYTINVVSSDIAFWYNGFRIPALNVGNGESIIDVNALAEKVLY